MFSAKPGSCLTCYTVRVFTTLTPCLNGKFKPL